MRTNPSGRSPCTGAGDDTAAIMLPLEGPGSVWTVQSPFGGRPDLTGGQVLISSSAYLTEPGCTAYLAEPAKDRCYDGMTFLEARRPGDPTQLWVLTPADGGKSFTLQSQVGTGPAGVAA